MKTNAPARRYHQKTSKINKKTPLRGVTARNGLKQMTQKMSPDLSLSASCAKFREESARSNENARKGKQKSKKSENKNEKSRNDFLFSGGL